VIGSDSGVCDNENHRRDRREKLRDPTCLPLGRSLSYRRPL